MDSRTTESMNREKYRLSRSDAEFDMFVNTVSQRDELGKWPLASRIEEGIPVYEASVLENAAGSPDARQDLLAELTGVLLDGAGVLVVKGAVSDLAVIDRATEVFDQIIEEEREGTGGGADHFAKPGANDRIWNSLQKHCIADPDNFMRYYASECVATVAEAWLGDGYQMTAQVNRVNPGGSAQTAHRDYHLGFMSADRMAKYPRHVHQLSPVLTLQGGIAHCDMPVESGPTIFLPHSQKFEAGYLVFDGEDYQKYFQDNCVQLPLAKGDAVFFNPALMHAAGTNRSTDIYRMANLLQISSAFGRAMENVDRAGMCKALYPVLKSAANAQQFSARQLQNVIAASAEGYSFPTNLDSDPPTGGLAPETQAQLFLRALENNLEPELFDKSIEELIDRQQA